MSAYPEIRPDHVSAVRAAMKNGGETLPFDMAAAASNATPQELAVASVQVLAASGVLRPASIFDATFRQVQAVAAAYGVLQRWWPAPGMSEMPLGEALKSVPPDVAREVLGILQWGDLLDVVEGGDAS